MFLQDHATKLLKSIQLTVALNRGANLLRTRGNSEERLGLDAVIKSITCNRRSTGHVLIRGVCARADQTDLELLRPVVGLDSLGEFGDGCSKIRGEGTIDVWLEFRKVQLDELIVLQQISNVFVMRKGEPGA